MRGELVALDLETTGLDVEHDSIIEIGAVRIRSGEIVDEFGMLVNPGFVIPAETTHITGIHQDDLRNAPLLTAVLPQISAFVGSAPVVAHNVAFDISFMRRFGVLKQNFPIDTYELASLLLPRVPRYSLGSLAEYFGIDLENAHRALDDARATAILYWKLWKKALALPRAVLEEINRAMHPFQWEAGEIFRAALQEKTQETNAPEAHVDAFAQAPVNATPLMPVAERQLLDSAQVSRMLGADGQFARATPGYEERPQQIRMAQHISEAFNQGEHVLIEAGTGTGKSLAYLVPAVQWALQNQQRVLISTQTNNLQDQLLNHDIPLLRKVFDAEFRAAVMKGRSHYLCPRRLDALRRRQPSNVDELHTLVKILIWLQESQHGERSEITLRSDEFFTWNRLSAEDEGCTTHRCQSAMGGTCPYFRARQRAESAHLVIANHALLVRDAAAENRVLPDYQYLIIDEAHQLEDAITQGMSLRVEHQGLLRRVNDLGGTNSGLLGDFLHSARNHTPEKQVLRLEVFLQHIDTARKAMLPLIQGFFNAIHQFVHDSHSENSYKIRLDEKKRGHSAFSNVVGSWPALNDFFTVLVNALQQLSSAMVKLEKYHIPNFSDHQNAIAAAAHNLGNIHAMLRALIEQPDVNTIYWINNHSNAQYLSLQAAPLHVGTLMEAHLWRKKASVVLTSATLRTAGSFHFLKERLYADAVQEVALGSPFDYQQSTLIYIPQDVPMPQENGYQHAVEKGIVELAAALKGNLMVLFTSYSQLRETAANVGPRLALGNITVYDQATGGSREALLESFKSTERAVLLGTRSFWEGVDIPGASLSALMIVRLPFAVPNDPIFAARSASYNDPFQDYAVPDAILRFRQGFGRLIRTREDRGIVTIFDSRIIHKSYGRKFLDSLPDCTIQYGQLENLASAAQHWLNRPPSTD